MYIAALCKVLSNERRERNSLGDFHQEVGDAVHALAGPGEGEMRSGDPIFDRSKALEFNTVLVITDCNSVIILEFTTTSNMDF